MDKNKILLNNLNLKNIPQTSGIYIFYNAKFIPLYIGKANNLRSRLSSYLTKYILGKTKNMIESSKYFSFIQTQNEIEALILEAKLIKHDQPKYNFICKDDKSYLYIVITKETYSRILMSRKLINEDNFLMVFGPYPTTSYVKNILKYLRKVFPYSTHKISSKPCFLSQINLCSPCPSYIESLTDPILKINLRNQYKKNINYILRTLNGKFKLVHSKLLKELKYYSKIEDYENANLIKEKLNALDYITQTKINPDQFLKNPNLISDIKENELSSLKSIISRFIPINNLKRIECYDISHISGTHIAASMVTFINGFENKNYYRHFKVRNTKKADDISSLSEIAKRRFKHLEDWGKPDLIIVDGGKGQIKAFWDIFFDTSIPVLGIAKNKETLIIPIVTNKILCYSEIVLKEGPAKNLVVRLRNEAHRFAQKYHHILIKKEFLL